MNGPVKNSWCTGQDDWVEVPSWRHHSTSGAIWRGFCRTEKQNTDKKRKTMRTEAWEVLDKTETTSVICVVLKQWNKTPASKASHIKDGRYQGRNDKSHWRQAAIHQVVSSNNWELPVGPSLPYLASQKREQGGKVGMLIDISTTS